MTYKIIIERWLTEDLRAPRKQRHTAQRIFERLRTEEHFQGSLSTVQNYVRKIRKKLGQSKHDHIISVAFECICRIISN